MTIFDEIYCEYIMTQPYSHKSVTDCSTILNICNKFALKPKSLFDQSTGVGSIVIPFEKTTNCYGIDISKPAIDSLKKISLYPNNYTVDDSRYHIQKADLILNWHTSFSFFPEDLENIKVLMSARQSLNPNGLFILELYNKDYTIQNFSEVFSQTILFKNKELKVQRKSSLTHSNKFLTSSFLLDVVPTWNKTQTIRLYSEKEVIALAKLAGLNLVSVLNHNLKDLTSKDSRIIFIFS
jgi:SAM-dependent methyltransferase